jgi:hypothetical protein
MFEGAHLPITMLAINAAEMEQAERCPDWRRADRIGRSVMIYQRGNRAACWFGCLLQRIGHRLQEYGTPQTLPLRKGATQQG